MRKVSFLILLLVLQGFMYVAYGQSRSVSGVVIADDDNAPMRDVSVVVKGTGRGIKTNEAGHFSLQASDGEVLVFSFIDYARQEITVKPGVNTYNVRLVQSLKELGNVVVNTAYGGRANKRSLTYQAQSVAGAEIAETQKDNWINALAGKVAGANITPTAGVPGASSTIVLRGVTSLSQNNQPLFVVDGVPYDNQTVKEGNMVVTSDNRYSDYTNRAADLNPADIESVTILQGPEAAALYGSDGASGAIVITTKKGKAGKISMNYDNSFRFETEYMFPKVQTTYSRGLNGIYDPNATVNPFGAGAIYAYFGPKYKPGTQLYDNIHNFFNTGFTQKHNLSIDGGSDLATYRFSVSYLDQDGVVPMTGYQKINARLSGTARFSPKFNLTTTLAYTYADNNKASKGAGSYMMNLLNFPADIDVRNYKNPDGTRMLYRAGNTSLTAEFDNPLWDVNKNRSADKTDRITTNVTISAPLFKWLTLSNMVGIDMYNTAGYNNIHPLSRAGFSTNGRVFNYQNITRNFSNVTTAVFSLTTGSIKHGLTLGFTPENNYTKIESQAGYRFYERDFFSMNNTDPQSRLAMTAILHDRKVRGFGNYTFNFKDQVYLSLAGSREGTSKLMSRTVDKDPYYYFGSASASYIFTELPWFKGQQTVSYGKLRLSYGTTGKGPNSPYVIDNAFSSQITTGGGYAYNVTGNNFGLKPERTQNLEYGGEIRFLNNRIGLDVTRYELKTKDQIIVPRFSYGSGFVLKYLNGGSVRNRGINAILDLQVIKRTDLTWNLKFNFDHNRGKVLTMPKDLPSYYDSDTWVFGNLRGQSYPGTSTGNMGAFSPLRNYQGLPIISSTTGLPLNFGDFVNVGDRNPDFKTGIVSSLTYKNISLNLTLDTRKGGDVFNGNEYWLYLNGLSTRTLDRETPITIKGVLNDGLHNTSNPTINTIVVTPYFRSDYYGSSAITEADFIESVDWVRLRDVTLSYRLPATLLSRQKIVKSASVFVTGTDLFIITNYTGADPSVSANTAGAGGFGGIGIDFGALSTPRGINFGCRLNF